MLFAGMSSCRILLLHPVLFLGFSLAWIRSHSPHPFSPHSHPQKQSLWQKFPCSYFTLASAPRTGVTGRVTQGRRESHSKPDPDPNPLWGWSPQWAPGPPLGPPEELCKGGLRCISLRDWLQLSQVKVTLRGQLPALQDLCICQIDWVHPPHTSHKLEADAVPGGKWGSHGEWNYGTVRSAAGLAAVVMAAVRRRPEAVWRWHCRTLCCCLRGDLATQWNVVTLKCFLCQAICCLYLPSDWSLVSSFGTMYEWRQVQGSNSTLKALTKSCTLALEVRRDRIMAAFFLVYIDSLPFWLHLSL